MGAAGTHLYERPAAGGGGHPGRGGGHRGVVVEMERMTVSSSTASAKVPSTRMIGEPGK
ncbi:hypothetical protein SANTM175S_05724 [Streptomyces antimycoticus]